MFEPEYIHLVIKPKVDLILEEGVESISDLTTKFNVAFSCKASKTRITEWLKALGYRVTRTVLINRPTQMTRTSTPPTSGEFNVLPQRPVFDVPPPMSTFTNVQMPGFQD